MMLEPGDTVRVEGQPGEWRVMRLGMDETPSVMLERVSAVVYVPDEGSPRPGEVGVEIGSPFFRVIELPPLPGSESDGRPAAVVAAEPWRSMGVFAGPSPDSLSARAEITRPATVGVLMESLARGCRHRWDEVNTLTVRIEGRAPESRTAVAVFAGANSAVVETTAGWELVQFQAAELLAPDVWRLGGLLRGQQGTEAAMTAGAAQGALVVILDGEPARAESPRAERGLPLIWRAGPTGGRAGVSEVSHTATGVHDRPWSPAHLRAECQADGGFEISWIARTRIDGDRWAAEPSAPDAMRFQLRLLEGTVARRTVEVETRSWAYSAAHAAIDFPGGFGANAAVAVAQWGDGYGWGVEARAPLR